jgi:serine protease Do
MTIGLWAAAVLAQDPARVHADFYKRVSPAVVGVRQGQDLRETETTRLGSGVIVDERGYVLASAVTVRDEREVTVFFKGGGAETAAIVARDPDRELAVLKLSGKRPKYPAVALGDSKTAAVGTVCYVLGDSYNSIVTDGQPAISVGVLSARYELKAREESRWAGEVLETTAACNPNQTGAPLLDAQGRLLGLITMNYHDARFCGVAVPVEALGESVARALEGKPIERATPVAAAGWIGAEFEEADGQVKVALLAEGGPAQKAGLQRGDLVVSLTHAERSGAIRTLGELHGRLASVAPGQPLTLRIFRESENKERDVALTAGRKEKP